MATAADDLYTVWQNWVVKLAEASAGPMLPKYTIPGGASVDFEGYYEFLSRMEEAAHKAYLRALGPFTVISVAR